MNKSFESIAAQTDDEYTLEQIAKEVRIAEESRHKWKGEAVQASFWAFVVLCILLVGVL